MLRTWLPDGAPASFPYREVLGLLRRSGKHFVPEAQLQQLASVRAGLPSDADGDEHSRHLRAFLDMVLDKKDGTYNYATYIALPMLGLARFERMALTRAEMRQACDNAIVCLMADAIRFEGRAAGEGDCYDTYLPLRVPQARLVRHRCALGVKAIRPSLRRKGIAEPAETRLQEWAWSVIHDAGSRPGGITEWQLDRSMLPVYRIHDEHLFLRMLQLSEVVLFWVAQHLRAAREALGDDARGAREMIAQASAMMAELSHLFSLLSSLDRDSFLEFRQYTEGASAIQSHNYKNVESLCRLPEPQRLNSVAYLSVPELRANLLQGGESLEETFRAAIAQGRMDEQEIAAMYEEMSYFSTALWRWRRAHYGIALKMLGPERGTGYTEGTPYLKAVRDLPVFDFVAESRS